jgi:hypothetical protein
MKKKLIFAVIALFMGVSMSFAQTVDDIINKNVEAMGGKEKLAGLKALKLVMSIEVGPNMKAPASIILVNGTKLRLDMTIQGMTMVQVITGDSGWAINPFGGKTDPERMNKDDIQGSKDQLNITGELFDYKAKGNTVELIGKEDMEGTDTYKLKVTKKNGDTDYIYLDAKTYLELKITSKHKFKDKEVESDELLSNYKKVDGLMFAFTREERQAGSQQGETMTADVIEVNPKIDEKIFIMPAVTSAATPAAPAGK